MTTMQPRFQCRRELATGKNFLFAGLSESELCGFEDRIKLCELRAGARTPKLTKLLAALTKVD